MHLKYHLSIQYNVHILFKQIISLSDVAEIEELSEPEFASHAHSIHISASSFQCFQL